MFVLSRAPPDLQKILHDQPWLKWLTSSSRVWSVNHPKLTKDPGKLLMSNLATKQLHPGEVLERKCEVELKVFFPEAAQSGALVIKVDVMCVSLLYFLCSWNKSIEEKHLFTFLLRLWWGDWYRSLICQPAATWLSSAKGNQLQRGSVS